MTLNREGKAMPDYALREMIKAVGKKYPNLWDRWNKKEVIPNVVLLRIWDSGLKIFPEPPTHGLKLGTFLDLLWKLYLSQPEGKDRDAVIYFYIDTVQSERLPYWRNKIRRKEKLRY